MGRKSVPVKTNEGAHEIKARALGLAPRIRTALLLVDGVKSVAELERLMSAAGVTPGALQLLLDKGLIHFQEDLTENSVVAALPEAADFTVAPTIFAPAEASVIVMPIEVTGADERGAKRIDAKAIEVKAIKVKAIDAKAAALIAPQVVAAPKSEPVSAPVQAAASLAVANLMDLETILGEATKLEIKTILGVATKLELTPTQLLAPNTVVKVVATEQPRLPPLVQAAQQYMTAPMVQKQVMPAAVLRMNLTVARAHLANALDQFVEIDGYALKQKVVACESRTDLEQLFLLVENALNRKIDKPAVARVMGIAQALLER
jgi:hypothetical protein